MMNGIFGKKPLLRKYRPAERGEGKSVYMLERGHRAYLLSAAELEGDKE